MCCVNSSERHEIHLAYECSAIIHPWVLADGRGGKFTGWLWNCALTDRLPRTGTLALRETAPAIISLSIYLAICYLSSWNQLLGSCGSGEQTARLTSPSAHCEGAGAKPGAKWCSSNDIH